MKLDKVKYKQSYCQLIFARTAFRTFWTTNTSRREGEEKEKERERGEGGKGRKKGRGGKEGGKVGEEEEEREERIGKRRGRKGREEIKEKEGRKGKEEGKREGTRAPGGTTLTRVSQSIHFMQFPSTLRSILPFARRSHPPPPKPNIQKTLAPSQER